MSHKTRSVKFGNAELALNSGQRRYTKNRYHLTRRFRARHPEKYRAHIAVSSAIRAGRLVRPKSCPSCGSETKVQAHHDDYRKPLEVRWLCRACHRAHHATPKLTVHECAYRLNVHHGLVRRLIAAKKLAASRVSVSWFVESTELEAFIDRHSNVIRRVA